MHSVSGGGKEFSTAWRGTADESCANAEFTMHGGASGRNARGTSNLQLFLCGLLAAINNYLSLQSCSYMHFAFFVAIHSSIHLLNISNIYLNAL